MLSEQISAASVFVFFLYRRRTRTNRKVEPIVRRITNLRFGAIGKQESREVPLEIIGRYLCRKAFYKLRFLLLLVNV
ncbi:hypothetical protein Nepgr_014560 [Nepenthes gracilis]|uniref:Uncharacterized protein n=1 Tax=Nepenthes gracilis TaxID=150966 RepID=A0AAD3XQ90_NEPGR|nr:hypothetical protein Nepgr_014560 [Nepenthes gracilis]